MALLQFFLFILGMNYTGEHEQVSRSISLPHAFPVKAVALQGWHDSSTLLTHSFILPTSLLYRREVITRSFVHK